MPRRSRYHRVYILHTGGTQEWVSLGHGVEPPGVPKSVVRAFGKPRFSREQQLADPDAQRTRVVKEFLSVGRFAAGKDDAGKPLFVTFSADHLKQIYRNFRLMYRRGVAVNLCYTHGDPNTGLVHPKDLIAPIAGVAFDGSRLWLSAYVNTEQARILKRASSKVSPRIELAFTDGVGRTYDGMSIAHVAVTDHPAQPGQGPFLELANGAGKMAEDVKDQVDAAVAAEAGETASETTAADVAPEFSTEGYTAEMHAELIDLINQVLPGEVEIDPSRAADLVMLVGILREKVETLKQVAGDMEEGDTMDEPPTESAMPEGTDPVVAEMSLRLRKIERLIAKLDAGHGTSRAALYEDRLTALAKAGKINGAQKVELSRIGRKHGFDLSLLKPFESASGASGSAVKHLRTAAQAVPQNATEQYLKERGLERPAEATRRR